MKKYAERQPRATWLRDLPDHTGQAALYRLDPPLDGHDHVIVSSAVVLLVGPETVVFPADAEGRVLYAKRLLGSSQGTLSHTDALSLAGYRQPRDQLAHY